METIKFSNNWNGKLSNKAFTTFRPHNPEHYSVGKEYRIELRGKYLGNAVLRSMRMICPDQLNDFVSYLDTGYSAREMVGILLKMYPALTPKTPFDFCLFVYTHKEVVDGITRRQRASSQATLSIP